MFISPCPQKWNDYEYPPEFIKSKLKKTGRKNEKKGVSFDGFAYSDGQIVDDLV